MLSPEHHSGLNTGKQALTWVLGQAHVWYLLYRCAHYVSKANDPSQSSVSILDSLFSVEDDLQDARNQRENDEEPDINDGEYKVIPHIPLNTL